MIRYSILVPVYNVEKYIKDCIESVLKQTYSNFELLLVDDGSKDRSGEICDEYALQDPRIKVFHKPNRGLIHTRVYARERARGEYYVFLDSDDMIKKNALELIDLKIQEYHCDCLIYGYERIKDGRIISQVHDSEEIVLCDRGDIYRKVFFSPTYNSLCRKVVKADVFQDIDYSSYYRLGYTEDLLQSLEIYKYAKKIVFIPDVLYEYRINPVSITNDVERDNIDYDYTIRRRVSEFLEQEGEFSDNELNRYRDYCIQWLTIDITRIGYKNISNKKKKELLAQIRDSDYYQMFLKKGITNPLDVGKNSILFYLFQSKQDDILLGLFFIKKTLFNKKV